MRTRGQRATVVALIAVVLAAGIAGGALAAGEFISRSAILSGGGQVSAGPVALRAAAAQPVAGRVSQGGTGLCAGIACPATTPPVQGGTVYTVTVTDFVFAPDPLEIEVGDTVVWQRLAGTHNVQADDGGFSSGAPSAAWSTFQHTFTAAGIYGYHCTAHGGPGSGMFGIVIVLAPPFYSMHLPLIQH